MALLSRLYGLNAASPLAALTQQQQTPQLGFEWQTPSMLPQTQGPTNGAVAVGQPKQSAPFDPNAPQVQRTGFWGQAQDRFANLDTNPLFNIGMSLLGNAQGSNWAGVGQDVREFGQQRMQRQRMDNEDRRLKAADARDNTLFERQRSEWGQQDQRRAAWQAAVDGEQDPSRRAQLAAIGPDAYGDWLQRQDEMEFQRQRASVQDRQFDRSLAVDYARLGQDRLDRSLQGALGRQEADYIGGMRGRLDNWRMVDNDLARIENWLNTRPDVFSSLLDGTEEEVLRRYTRRGDQEALTAAQELYAIGSSLAREELRGQTPVSNIDFLAALRGNPTTASSPAFVRSWLDRAQADRQMMETQYQAALRHGQQYGNLYATDPSTGLNFYQSQYSRYTPGQGQQAQAGAQTPRGARERWGDYRARTGGGQAPSQARSPRPGDVVDGWRFNGGDPSNRANWRQVSGR